MQGRKPAVMSLDIMYDAGEHNAYLDEKRALARRYREVDVKDVRVLAEIQQLEAGQKKST